MTALEDHRPVAATTTISRHPNVIGEDLAQLLLEHPDIELASIRLIPSTEHDGVGIAGRIGQIVEQTAEYPCCHQLIGRPHTEYCSIAEADEADEADEQMREWFPKLFARIEAEVEELDAELEQRPDDDPAPIPTCDGRNCGGQPHA
ncbi:MAG TPA: hypothetical protein VIP28_13265 [Nocardioides sp.]